MSEIIARPLDALTKTDVSEIHKREWQAFRQTILAPAADSGDKDQATFAKSIADSIRIAQEGERRAWGFVDVEVDNEITISWMSEGANES